MLNNKTILITGGTGSFGKKCVQTILNNYTPKKLIVFSRDELKQFEMAQQFQPSIYGCMRYFIGDVRDKDRLYRAFKNVDYVIHAAALKQVPAAEYNPTECIRTNIVGAENVISAAADCGVEKVVALSTDKAVNPINLYGATKLCSDKLFIAANAFTGCSTKFSVVRYGNVMGSRGSVIPFFIQQRDQGVLPITDPRMTRFWISLEEGINLVLHALSHSSGGEIYVPKIPSMRVTELAEAVAPNCTHKIVGLRPGEKINECMIPGEESHNTWDMGKYYMILPAPELLNYKGNLDGAKRLSEGYEYNSGTNDHWLTVQELRTALRAQGFDVPE